VLCRIIHSHIEWRNWAEEACAPLDALNALTLIPASRRPAIVSAAVDKVSLKIARQTRIHTVTSVAL